MGLIPISKIRKSELQKAAFEVLFTQGFQSITVEQIADRAGISKGIVHHYFKSKQQLLRYAVRHGHAMYRTAVVTRLKEKRSPSERLWAIIDGNFAPEIFHPELCRIWLSVFDASYGDEQLRRLFEIVDARTISNIALELRRLGDSQAKNKSYAIMNFIDGLWILAASQPEATRARALTFMRNYITENVALFDPAVVERLE
jgi:TetR/AcrR family transcriptional regulator, transcriptional repressor of bet genes